MDADLFLSAINQSIDEWTELKHVIEVYGAGGSDAPAKLLWMADVLFDYFRITPMDQLQCEIHDYIETMVDNEFDFVPMDKSLDVLISKLLEYHSLWSTGQPDKIKSIMEERRKVNEIKREAIAKETKSLDESLRKIVLSTGKSNEEPSTLSNINESAKTGDPCDSNKPADVTGLQSGNKDHDSSEWVTVNSKKRSNRKR